ncbi:MAG: aminopeptidase P N-terminal domain-containing protein [Bacteroidetes bacterium]|nr:aminopeptidase P N-terminal domain-containing protein [Bacteroidota bacterium]
MSFGALAQWDDTDPPLQRIPSAKKRCLKSADARKICCGIFANPVRNRSNDVDFQFSQNPNFYYLTDI